MQRTARGLKLFSRFHLIQCKAIHKHNTPRVVHSKGSYHCPFANSSLLVRLRLAKMKVHVYQTTTVTPLDASVQRVLLENIARQVLCSSKDMIFLIDRYTCKIWREIHQQAWLYSTVYFNCFCYILLRLQRVSVNDLNRQPRNVPKAKSLSFK